MTAYNAPESALARLLADHYPRAGHEACAAARRDLYRALANL
ncbi:MAG: hypothetical protein ACRDTT_09885 [Pseudonocardiaceae bacterium]